LSLAGPPARLARSLSIRSARAAARSAGDPPPDAIANPETKAAAPTHRLLVKPKDARKTAANRAQEKRPFAAVGKAVVDNLDLAPETVVALAENDID
jgi:hypothetical protein